MEKDRFRNPIEVVDSFTSSGGEKHRWLQVAIERPGDPDHPWTLRADRFLLNDIRFPWESHPNSLFVIGDEMGPTCAVWADSDGDALGEAVDQGWLDYLMVDPEDWNAMTEAEQGDYALLGNASEPFETQYLWIKAVDLSIQTTRLLCLLAEARGSGHPITLEDAA